MKIKSYSIELNGIPPIVKSVTILGAEGNCLLPLAYIRKPKGISEESFRMIVNAIKLDLPSGFEVKESL